MPELQDIEHLKQTLKPLGNEPAILEEWGENWQNVEVPIQLQKKTPQKPKLSDDIASLLDTGNDTNSDNDFKSFLDNIDIGETADTNPLPSNFDDSLEDASSDNLDSSALDISSDDLLAMPDISNIDIPDTNASIDEIPEAESLPDISAEEIPEVQDFKAPSDTANGVHKAPEVSDLEDFSLPDISTDEIPEVQDFEAPSDTANSVSDLEDFSIPDIADITSDNFDNLEEPKLDNAEPIDDLQNINFDEAATTKSDNQTPAQDDFSTIEMPDFDNLEKPQENFDTNNQDSFFSDLDADLESLNFDSKPNQSANTDGSNGADDLSQSIPDIDNLSELPDANFDTDNFSAQDIPSLPEDNLEALPIDDAESLEALPIDEAESLESIPDISSESSNDTSFDSSFTPDQNTEDAFDQFSFGNNDIVPDLDISDFAKSTETNDFDKQLANLDEEPQTSENFSLDSDWGGKEFSIPGFEMGNDEVTSTIPKSISKAQLDAALNPSPKEKKKVREVNLSEKQVDKLQDTLLSYPLNLRLAIEDIVSNNTGTEAAQSELIWMLVEGASPREAAKSAGKILKKYIEVPAGFTKRTGAALEEEKGSFKYLFVHSILPVLQVIVLVAIGAGILFYLGYKFAYVPIKANSLYKEGFTQIDQKRYEESEDLFNQADKMWPFKNWYYKYAENYNDKHQVARAENMYERLLFRWPKEYKAAMQYATMESKDILDYEKADKVLNQYILNNDYFNKDALLLSIDNFLAWAESEFYKYNGPDNEFLKKLYENARVQLATIMEHHGRSDEYLERMLLYLIRSENITGNDMLSNITPLADYLSKNKKTTWAVTTIAELGEYLLAREETEFVNDMLHRGAQMDSTVPEIHVAMAKWKRHTNFPQEELQALENASICFNSETQKNKTLTIKRTKSYIESMMRLGELRVKSERIIDAEEAFNLAIDLYETALEEKRFKPSKEFGRAYSLLADIYYKNRKDFDAALNLYAKAENHNYTSPDCDYRQGYINYAFPKDDGKKALEFFYRAGLNTTSSPYLIMATANALYKRNNYFAAQGYYKTLATKLQFELDTITLPSPQQKASHQEVVNLLMQARNNLGAALYQVAERTGDSQKRAEAMAEFTESVRLFDSLTRNQISLWRPTRVFEKSEESRENENVEGPINYAFNNLDFVFHPARGSDIIIYDGIPPEMNYPQ